MTRLIALVAGILFGFGLAFSGMTDTHKVLGFLSIFHDWDYDLTFVMGGALIITTLTFQWTMKHGETLLGGNLHLPSACDLDPKLVSGAILFGVGWGLFGYCPGPALTALIYLEPQTVVFVVSMLIGILAHDFFATLSKQSQ
jgi:uncharacterized membrane protein YedE/YeeE